MFRRLCLAPLAVVLAIVLFSCGTLPEQGHSGVRRADLNGANIGQCGDRFSPGEGLELSVASDLHQQGRSRSALAHLEALDLPYPDARLLQADALRHIGELGASDALYRQLTDTCLAARAYRGLALNAFEARQMPSALRLMAQARRAAPTDAGIRNDLGYLMMLDGNHSAAEEEFLTVLELDAAHVSAAQNLVMLYFYRGMDDKAYRVAQTYNIRESTLLAIANNVKAGP